MTQITSRDNVTLVEIQNLDSAGSLVGTDEFIISQVGGAIRKTTFDDIFGLAASAQDLDDLETTFLTALGDYVTLATTQTISGDKTFTGEVNVEAAVNPSNPITKSVFDALETTVTNHVGSTSNPHNVTPAQVGNTTAQWNANQLQGVGLSSTAPTDGQAIIYNQSAGEYQPTDSTSITTGSQTFTGEKTFQDTAFFTDSLTGLAINTSAGQTGRLAFMSGGNKRFELEKSNDAETGSDAGSNFNFNSLDDAGNFKANLLNVNRATGLMSVNSNLVTNGTLTINGSSSVPNQGVNDASNSIANTRYVQDTLTANMVIVRKDATPVQVAGSSTWTPVVWDAARYAPTSIWNGSGAFTIPTAGIWEIQARGSVQSTVAASLQRCIFSIEFDSTISAFYLDEHADVGASKPTVVSMEGCTKIDLTAGTVVRIMFWGQATSGTVEFLRGWCSLHLLGKTH